MKRIRYVSSFAYLSHSPPALFSNRKWKMILLVEKKTKKEEMNYDYDNIVTLKTKSSQNE